MLLTSVPNLSADVFGAVSSSTNFCNQFPTFPECSGWRTEPIYDNFWFCQYVDLPAMCNNPPDPQKEIIPRTGVYCCGIIGSQTPKNLSSSDVTFADTNETGRVLDISSYGELIIWTEKDHYAFGEQVNVYGKFNFDDPVLKNYNQFVDVALNDRKVVLDLPVHSNGWFAGYFTLSNPYLFYTGNNLITVSYFHTPTQHEPDKINQASYVFSTGDIKEESFSIVDKSSSQKMSYDVVTESGDLVNLNLAIVRLVTPDGLVLQLPNISSMDDIPDYLDIPMKPGQYEVTVTKGSQTASQIFEYVE